ncbi:hypothetical protein SKAU_G00094540 [Synaphobranchus kaupii]|uniref:BED-type domain-containing protein n=1 Tax=Synaphobranchus kaupii TaxID=118154 RepID=A0A9Q1FY98_SYNKA|nr:hypothetical protein SKAU_G00094540 [Synaphobranchus kaupii]
METSTRPRFVCTLCKAELVYCRSSSSLKSHLNAKHPLADVEDAGPSTDVAPGKSRVRQTTIFECNRGKPVSTALSAKLTNLLAQWIAINCRPISVVEDDGLELLLQGPVAPTGQGHCNVTSGRDFDGVLAKCRKVVGHFKHSPANSDELNAQQASLEQDQEPLVQDVPTRWNSTLEMIKRVRRNRDPLHATLSQQKHNLTLPTNAEYEKLAKLEKLLEPCRYGLQR